MKKHLLFTAVVALCAAAMPLRVAAVTATVDGVVYNLDTPSAGLAQVGDNSGNTATSITIPTAITVDGTVYAVTSFMTGTVPDLTGSESNATITNWLGTGKATHKVGGIITSEELTLNQATNTTLQTLVVQAPITQIPAGLLAGCTALRTVELPASVQTIGNYAFAFDQALTTIHQSGLDNGVLPSALTTLGTGAFAQCSALTTITFPEGVTEIPQFLFYHYFKDNSNHYAPFALAHVRFLGPVTKVGQSAFQRCYSLTDIQLPSTLETIEGYAFAGIKPAQTALYLPAIKTVGAYGLCDTPYSLIQFGPSLTSLADGALKNTIYPNALKTLIVEATNPPSVVEHSEIFGYELQGGTFKGLTPANITLYVPTASVATYKAATGWKEFTNIHGESNTIDGLVYQDFDPVEKTCWVGDNRNCTLSDVTIPVTVQHTGITYRVVGIIEGKTTLDTENYRAVVVGAFGGGVGSVTTDVNQDNILDQHDFQITSYANPRLQTLTILAPITRIPENMVAACQSLTSVTMPETVTSIGRSAFGLCNHLTGIQLPSGLTELEWGAFSDCEAITSITIPDGVTVIPGYLFYHYYNTDSQYTRFSLNTVVMGPNVTEIGDAAFQRCYNLTNVTMPARGLQTIGAFALAGLPATSITDNTPQPQQAPAAAPRMDAAAGGGELNLASIRTIGESGLADTRFSTIYLGPDLTDLGNNALKDSFRFNLRKLVIDNPDPSSITLGQNVFNIGSTGHTDEQQHQNQAGIDLIVPRGAEQAYQDADQWKWFHIIESPTTGIDDILDGAQSPADPGEIEAVYDLRGVLVARSLESLPAGIYVVRTTAGAAYKVMR